MASENHDQYDHGEAFSAYGDIDRMRDDGTSASSRAANAVAREAEKPIDFGRAFPQAGAGGSVGGPADHAYGDS